VNGTNSTLSATLDTSSVTTLGATAKLNSAALTLSGTGTLTVHDSATIAGSTITVGDGATFALGAAQANGKVISGDGSVDVLGAVAANANLTDISTTISFGGDNTVAITGGTLTLTSSQANQIAGGVTKTNDGAIKVLVESANEDLTSKNLGDVDSLNSTSGNSAILTVSQATALGSSNITGTYILKDTVAALTGANSTIKGNAASYTILDDASSIGAEIDANGVSGGSILGDAASIDTTDNNTIDLTVSQISAKGSAFLDGYDLSDTAPNLIGADQSVINAVVTASNDVKVAAGDANKLTVANHTTLLGRTTVDTWVHELEDTAAAIIAADGTSAVTGASTVSVIDNAAGTLSVASYNTLLGLTKPNSNDGWTYAIDDNPGNIDAELERVGGGDGNSTILGGASTVTITGTGASETLNLQSSVVGTINYTINMGAGVDNVTGGSGNDTIDLGAGDNAIDTYVFAATDVLNGEDVVSNFGSEDKIDVSSFETQGKLNVTGAPNITTTDGKIYYVNSSTSGAADAGQSVGAAFVINNSANWTDADATSWIVLTDNNSSAVYEFNDTAASNNGVQGSELTLIATIDEVLTYDAIVI
jgi:hypothetical protein